METGATLYRTAGQVGENGWTYDTEANAMLSSNRNQQKRLDQFVYRMVDFQIKDMEMIRQEVI
jgi:tyrosyl-DNA phosphodiesterase 2